MRLAIKGNERIILVLLTVITFPFKAWYMLSRPLFPSGPDAQTYIPATIDFANLDFFSSEIEGMPNWPAGYPWLQSFVYRINSDVWVEYTQILQLLLFSISIFLFFEVFTLLTSKKIAMISSATLILYPAWAVANGESMYETFLWFFSVFGFYLLICCAARNALVLLGGVSIGIAIVIHPRIIPVVVLFVVTVWKIHTQTKWNRTLFLVGSFLLPILFLIRNRIAEGVLTLSDALRPSIVGYHPKSMYGCGSLECVPASILNHPLEFLQECIFNLYAFWSPHSGSMARGSWFHNISLFSALERVGLTQISVVFALSATVFAVCIASLGCLVTFRDRSKYRIFLLLTFSYFISTDFFIFGDNRHRLIAMLVSLPLQIIGIETLFRFTRKIEKSVKGKNYFSS